MQNDKDSAVDAYICGPFRQDFRLDQGESVELRVCNLNLIYARTDTGTARIRYLAYRADI